MRSQKRSPSAHDAAAMESGLSVSVSLNKPGVPQAMVKGPMKGLEFEGTKRHSFSAPMV